MLALSLVGDFSKYILFALEIYFSVFMIYNKNTISYGEDFLGNHETDINDYRLLILKNRDKTKLASDG